MPKASISCSSLTKHSLPNNTSCTDIPLDQIVSGPAAVPCTEIFNQNVLNKPVENSNKIVVELNDLLHNNNANSPLETDPLAFNSNENSNEKAAIDMSLIIQKSKLISQKSGGSHTANSQSENTRDSGLLTAVTGQSSNNVFHTMITTTSPEMITTAGDPSQNLMVSSIISEKNIVGKKLTEIQKKLTASNSEAHEDNIGNGRNNDAMEDVDMNSDLSESEYETCNISSAGFLGTNSSSNENFDEEDYKMFARKSRENIDLTQIGYINHINTPIWPSLEAFQQSGYCRFKTEHHQMLMRSVNPNKLRSISSRIRRQQMQCLDTSLNQNQHLRILAKVQNDIEKRQRIEKKSREARKKGERNLFLDELNHVLNIQYKNYAHCLMESNLIKKPKKESRSSSKNKLQSNTVTISNSNISTKSSSNVKNNLGLGFQNINAQNQILRQQQQTRLQQQQILNNTRQNLLGSTIGKNSSSATLHQMLHGGIGGLTNNNNNNASNSNSHIIAQL